jgi:hypothetical protein
MQVVGGRVLANSNPKEEARPRRSQATQTQGRARVASMAPKGSSNNGSSPREGAKVEPRAKAKAKKKGRKVKAKETMAIGADPAGCLNKEEHMHGQSVIARTIAAGPW